MNISPINLNFRSNCRYPGYEKYDNEIHEMESRDPRNSASENYKTEYPKTYYIFPTKDLDQRKVDPLDFIHKDYPQFRFNMRDNEVICKCNDGYGEYDLTAAALREKIAKSGKLNEGNGKILMDKLRRVSPNYRFDMLDDEIVIMNDSGYGDSAPMSAAEFRDKMQCESSFLKEEQIGSDVRNENQFKEGRKDNFSRF